MKLNKRLDDMQGQIQRLESSDTDSQEDVATPDGSILNDRIEEEQNLDEGELEEDEDEDENDEVKISEEPSTPKSAKTIRSNLQNLVRSSQTKREELKDFSNSLIINEVQTIEDSADKPLSEGLNNILNQEKLQNLKTIPLQVQGNLEDEPRQELQSKAGKETNAEPQPQFKPKELKLNDDEMKESINQTQQMNVQVTAKKKEPEVLFDKQKTGPIKVENENKKEKGDIKPKNSNIRKIVVKDKKRETSSDIQDVLQPNQQSKVTAREKNSITPLNNKIISANTKLNVPKIEGKGSKLKKTHIKHLSNVEPSETELDGGNRTKANEGDSNDKSYANEMRSFGAPSESSQSKAALKSLKSK